MGSRREREARNAAKAKAELAASDLLRQSRRYRYEYAELALIYQQVISENAGGQFLRDHAKNLDPPKHETWLRPKQEYPEPSAIMYEAKPAGEPEPDPGVTLEELFEQDEE